MKGEICLLLSSSLLRLKSTSQGHQIYLYIMADYASTWPVPCFTSNWIESLHNITEKKDTLQPLDQLKGVFLLSVMEFLEIAKANGHLENLNVKIPNCLGDLQIVRAIWSDTKVSVARWIRVPELLWDI